MAGTEQPTILVIEDERELTEMYERWLDDRFEVVSTYDGEEALAALGPTVDVVILDRIMPALSGDEVLEHIEARDLACRVAIVSAVEPDFDVIEMGFDDYLTKPVGGDELLAVVEKLLKRNRYTDRMQEYFSLVAKKAVLDATKTEREREASERYATLVGHIEDLDREVTELRSALRGDEDVTVAFRDLAAGEQ